MRIAKIINESEVLQKYQSGMSINQIRKHFKVKFDKIKKILSSQGIVFAYRPKMKWTDDDIRNVALQYSSRYEFRTMNVSFYLYACRRKILDDVCSHMEQVGDRFKRMVYAYEFSDNCVYVGLTYNKEKRNKEHIRDGRGPVYKHIQNTGIEPKFIMISDYYIEYDLAQKMEKEYVERYKNNGWTLLNSAVAGNLGGNVVKWTEETLREESLKYKTRSEMQIKSPNAYSSIIQKKMKHLFSHMKWEGNIEHTLEECLEESKKYRTRNEFRRARYDLWQYTYVHKYEDIVFAHMENQRVYKWNTRDAVEISKKYKTIKDFMENDYRAWRHLSRHKDYQELTKHLERKN